MVYAYDVDSHPDGETPDAVSPSVSDEPTELGSPYLVVYEASRCFGGHEEGGWYWTRLAPHVALPLLVARDLLNDYISRKGGALWDEDCNPPLDLLEGNVTADELTAATSFRTSQYYDESRLAAVRRALADWAWECLGARVSRPNSIPQTSDKPLNAVPEYWSASPRAASHCVDVEHGTPFSQTNLTTEPWS